VDRRLATKSEGAGLIVCAISFQDFQSMWSQITNVTDRQTDGRHAIPRPRKCTKVHLLLKQASVVAIIKKVTKLTVTVHTVIGTLHKTTSSKKLTLNTTVFSYASTQFTSCEQNVHRRLKRTLAFSDIFPKQLGIFSPNFTHLLNVHIYARMQTFIQLCPTLSKLCHIKCDHPACISVHGGHFEHIMVVALNMA